MLEPMTQILHVNDREKIRFTEALGSGLNQAVEVCRNSTLHNSTGEEVGNCFVAIIGTDIKEFPGDEGLDEEIIEPSLLTEPLRHLLEVGCYVVR